MKKIMMLGAIAAATAFASAGNVNPDVIFGSGNANGGFTLGTDAGNTVELGLRAKVRYNAAGSPENTFNYDGGHTYTFNPADGNAPGNRAMWNFEWSVNTDTTGSTGDKLNDFTYQLAMFKVNADGTDINDAVAFDLINAPYFDHAIGDNTTGNGNGVVAADPTAYATLIGNKNVAQNSWNYDFFDGAGALTGWDPNQSGEYIIRLTMFDGGTTVATTDITVNVVPLPTAAFAGLGLLGVLGGARVIRRR